jgi:hypothetical protein
MSKVGGYCLCRKWCGSGVCNQCGWVSEINAAISQAPSTRGLKQALLNTYEIRKESPYAPLTLGVFVLAVGIIFYAGFH